ncbi:MAG: glycoside hydrolase family 10 protein [Acutalibacteraceae bacterium]
MKRFFCVILLAVVVCAVVFFVKSDGDFRDIPIFGKIPGETAVQATDRAVSLNSNSESEEMRCLWLTYSEIGALIKGKTEEEYRQALTEVFDNLERGKINTVFYQCRAFCDSFYESEIFPVSKYITVGGATPAFDPLEIFSEICRERNIKLHCWVNPYRVSYNNDFEKLSEDSPVRALYKKNKNSLIICDKGIYLNPATDEARELVLKGIREILDKYDADGIHFDDYFYPESEDLKDGDLYEEYKEKGGALSLGDWRRENVSALVSCVYDLVKSRDGNLLFGISPCADLEKSRNVYYGDVEKWCTEDGYIDYIIPQIYFGFENEKMPFEKVAREWETLAEGSNVKLLCGLGAYKCGSLDENAGEGKNEWLENVNILSRQYELISKSQVYQGFALFSYSYVFGENVNEISEKEIKSFVDMVE